MKRDHESVRMEYADRAMQRADESQERLFWPVPQRQVFTNDRLAEFLEFARERSPWHRARLENIDLSTVTAQDMSALSTMNKHDLHENWDAIVTDPELSLAVASGHLAGLKDGFSFALDRYVVCATGGSTGFRSVIALDLEGYAGWSALNIAHGRSSRPADLDIPDIPVQGRLTALNPIHVTGAISAIAQGAMATYVTIPPSTPIADAVSILNEAQPHNLTGYGSLLHVVAVEAIAGRLNIQPVTATNAGEPLLPETRENVREAFGIDMRNLYASTETYLGESWHDSELLHLGDDTTVIELVDADNQPVPPGTRSAKLLITNLSNRLQPLIRYEITDEVTEALIDADSDDPAQHPPGPWSGRWIQPPQGRNDDWFTYGDTIVHPHVFRSQLAAVPAISEYQVTQTASGAHIAAVTTDHIDTAALSDAVSAELRRVGLTNPAIDVETVVTIERHPETGKLRRFIRHA